MNHKIRQVMIMNRRPKPAKGTLKRLLKSLFASYPRLLPLAMCFIIFSAIVSAIPAVFMQNIMRIIGVALKEKLAWESVSTEILQYVFILAGLYILSITSLICFQQLLAVITQGFLKKMRVKMFNHMQTLPIKYFDTHNHGDIMSYYTNDIDTLRQLVSQSIPQFLSSLVIDRIFRILIEPFNCIFPSYVYNNTPCNVPTQTNFSDEQTHNASIGNVVSSIT